MTALLKVDRVSKRFGGLQAVKDLTFEVRDGRIEQWRDYFDMGLTGKLMGGENVDSVLPT